MFTRSAITPPKVNRFRWNKEHSEYIVGGWPWHILGAIRAVATVWEVDEIFLSLNNALFRRYPIGQISRNLNTTTSTGEAVNRTEFWKFYPKGSFFQKQRKKFSQIFNVYRLQAAITPQWLHIAGNSLPNDPSTGCLVSIFTVRINSK